MMMKIFKNNIITGIAAFLIILAPAGLFAQEGEGGYDESGYSDDSSSDGGVNSHFWGLILSGSAGYGQTTFGFVNDSISDSTLGVGPGGSISLGAMLNLSIFAVKVEYSMASLETLKWSQGGGDYEADGDGQFSTIDLLLGLKLFTEEGDMGYTHLYGGYRSWSIKRNVDKTTLNGFDAGLTPEYDITGGGWIAGYYDLSTFPIWFFSIVFETGLWVDSAPFKSLKVNGTEPADIEAGTSAGFGFKIGAGIAFEDMGLLVTAGVKMDFTATQFSMASYDDNLTGQGYVVGYIAASLEF